MAINKTGRVFDVLTGKIAETGKSMKEAARLTQGFKMHLLGLMFFGMMLQRVFLGIMKQGVDTFMRITEGQTEAGQAMTALSANVEFLKFAIGDAIATTLLPLLPIIVSIIEKIVDFISQNRELVGIVLIVGAVFGTFLAVFAILKLGFIALTQTFGVLSAVFTIGGAHILAIVAAIIVVAYLLYKAWETNFLNIRQIVGQMVRGIATILDVCAPVFKTMGRGAIFLFHIIKFAFESIEDIAFIVWDAIAIGTLETWNFIIRTISAAVNLVIDVINGLVYAANTVLTAFGQAPIKGIEKVAEGFGLIADTGGYANDIMERSMRITTRFGEAINATAVDIEGFEKQYDATVIAIGTFGEELIRQGEEINAKKASGEAMNFGESIAADIGNLAGMAGNLLGFGGAASGGNTVQNTVTVNTGPISSDIDIQDLANQVADRINEDTKLYMNPTPTKF